MLSERSSNAPSRSSIEGAWLELSSGALRSKVCKTFDIPLKSLDYWLGKYGYKLQRSRKINKYLRDENFVRAAHRKIEEGFTVGAIVSAIGASRHQLGLAFKKLDLIPPRPTARAAKIARIVDRMPQIAKSLETEKQTAIAKSLGVGHNLLVEVLKESGELKRYPRKGKDIWLSNVAPESVVSSFNLIEGKNSTFSIESKKHGISSTALHSLCVRLGLQKLEPWPDGFWNSRIPKAKVLAVFQAFRSGASSINKAAKALKISAPNLRRLFIRAGCRQAYTLALPDQK